MTAAIAVRAARIWSGLLLLAFVTCHLANLSLGLISIDAMDAARPYLSGIWGGPVLGPVLLVALLVHFGLGLWAIYKRPTLRTNAQDIVQLLTGVLVVPLLATHAIGIAMMKNAGVEIGYAQAIKLFWLDSPTIGLLQVTVLSVVWIHGSAGFLTWLRSKESARHILAWAYLMAVAIPIVALLGYGEAGRIVLADAYEVQNSQGQQTYTEATALDKTPSDAVALAAPEVPFELIKAITSQVIWGSIILAALAFAARWVRLFVRKTTPVTIVRGDGEAMESTSELSLLDGFRHNHQPHASLCEGRGRCGTCAVTIRATEFPLPASSQMELKTLKRVAAPEGARLACQLMPSGGWIKVDPLYPADYTFNDKSDDTAATTSDEVKP